jgi:3-methylcrotonyl-CoA carboxylase beta subunit
MFVRSVSHQKRAFGYAAAATHRKAQMTFTREDLQEFPELNRSFMKVLDSGIDTQSTDY